MSKHPKRPPAGRPQLTIVSDGTARGTTVFSADGQDLTSVLPILAIEIDISLEHGPIAKLIVEDPILRIKADNILLHPDLLGVK